MTQATTSSHANGKAISAEAIHDIEVCLAPYFTLNPALWATWERLRADPHGPPEPPFDKGAFLKCLAGLHLDLTRATTWVAAMARALGEPLPSRVDAPPPEAGPESDPPPAAEAPTKSKTNGGKKIPCRKADAIRMEYFFDVAGQNPTDVEAWKKRVAKRLGLKWDEHGRRVIGALVAHVDGKQRYDTFARVLLGKRKAERRPLLGRIGTKLEFDAKQRKMLVDTIQATKTWQAAMSRRRARGHVDSAL